jgi:hypothetical protein
MTLVDWAALIVSILTIISSVAYGIRWMVKHYLAELKPNGGSSLKDSVKRLEEKISEADQQRSSMDKKLDRMYEVLLDHIASNNK